VERVDQVFRLEVAEEQVVGDRIGVRGFDDHRS
jgi:hypothetical protein